MKTLKTKMVKASTGNKSVGIYYEHEGKATRLKINCYLNQSDIVQTLRKLLVFFRLNNNYSNYNYFNNLSSLEQK